MFLLITTISLSAKDIYVNVAFVDKQKYLINIYHSLNSLGYTMYTMKYKDLDRVYTGPFKDEAQANEALKIIKKDISKHAFVFILADEKEEVKPPKHNSFFIGLTAGGTKLNFDEKDINGNLILDVKLKDIGTSYGVESGYNFNKNIFTTINYQRTELENIYFDSAFMTLNYRFDEIYYFSPYIGILGGFNLMSWKNTPIDSINKNSSSSSYIGGLQIGSEIPISDKVKLYILYRYWMMEHINKIITSSAKKEIIYNSEQNIHLGIKYSF